MPDVFENVAYIRQARYGEQVRNAIADSIEQCYADATGSPNSLASIIKALAGGLHNGDMVNGVNGFSTLVNNVVRETSIAINSIYLKPGTWLLSYNAVFNPGSGETATNAQCIATASTLNVASEAYAVTNDSSTYTVINPDNSISLKGISILTVTEQSATITDSDPDKDGTALCYLYLFHYGLQTATAKSRFIAIKLKDESSGEDQSLTEQVAENTAAIANLQTLDTDISSIRSQHENDIDELTDLIEDSVVSLRASLDEKTLSLDENDYLTLN